jgi:hypothetical protein
MPLKRLLGGDSDLDDDSSESTLPTDPTLPGLAGLSLLDVCIQTKKKNFYLLTKTFIFGIKR